MYQALARLRGPALRLTPHSGGLSFISCMIDDPVIRIIVMKYQTYLQSPTHFDDVIERLEHATGRDPELDRAIRDLVLQDVNLRTRLNFDPIGRVFTSSMDAFYLITRGWWWHVSHLGVGVIPNAPDPQIPISNAIDYDRQGRAFEYHSHLWGDEREKIPRAVAAAALITHRALYLKALAITNNRMYLTQSGKGPRLVHPDGRITDLPYKSWLTDEGKLVARSVMFPDPEPEILPEDDES